ncbi:MAG: class I SAM-dependent methyltransferase [Candidatus Bathyarchaeota archaeon]|nr:class I SAM-dependent methyltransferase [Candidatus Bathyarchaeum tardum]
MQNNKSSDINKWTDEKHVNNYLEKMADNVPHKKEALSVLLEQIPSNVTHVLDLGTGDGRLLWMVLQLNPKAKGVALDFSDPMLKRARKRFENNSLAEVIKHDLNMPLPKNQWEKFDLVISGLAIHHLFDERKKQLYKEIFELLKPNGVFLNMEHVASATPELHQKFLTAVGLTPETDDPSNKLLDVHTQLEWLKQIGYAQVDCQYKWLEIAILTATKP